MAKAQPKFQLGVVANRANQAEKYLRWFVEFCPVPIAMFDCDLNYILVSQPWVKLLGVPRLKLIGTNIYDSLPVTIAHRQGLERCLSGGQMHYQAAVDIRDRGSSSCTCQLVVQPWYKDDGAAGGIIVAGQPITENQVPSLQRQLAEEVAERQYLEDAFNKIGTAIESANDAICITDESGQPIYINSAFSELFSFNLSQLKTPDQFLQLFVNQKVAHAIHNAVMHGGTWASELEMRDRYQQPIPIGLRANPVKDARGNVIGTTYVCTNIRDRKAAEAEINKSFVALGATLEATADGILVLDAIGNIIICNQKFVDLWRIPERVFRSNDDADILEYVANKIVVSKHLQNFGKDLGSDQNSFEIIEVDDGRTLECYSQPQHILDNFAGRVWSLRDITERLAAEALIKASEEKYRLQAQVLEQALRDLKSTQSQLIQAEKMSGLGQLVAGIAHEINNPVNFIYGNLTYAANYTNELLSLVETYRQHYPQPVAEVEQKLQEIDIDFLAEDFVKLIGSIRVGAERIQKIVQSLNKFSRSDESGCKPVDIHEGIESTLLILQSRLRTNSNRPEIHVEKRYGELPLVECYAGQLNQVFMNLLTNAIDTLEDDAQNNGGWQVIDDKPQWVRRDGKVSQITIQTEIVRAEKGLEEDIEQVTESSAETTVGNQLAYKGDRLRVKIADNGQGIPEDSRNRLFDLFFTTKPVGKGTGLGLSIAYQIVTENHGGKLYFHSETGKGTEFIIEIPLTQPQS